MASNQGEFFAEDLLIPIRRTINLCWRFPLYCSPADVAASWLASAGRLCAIPL